MPRLRTKSTSSKKHARRLNKKALLIGAVVLLLGLLAAYFVAFRSDTSLEQSSQTTSPTTAVTEPAHPNPLRGRTFYTDEDREVALLVAAHPELGYIASHPGTTWLTGPTATDPKGSSDIAAVKRTSAEAASLKTVPIYQLYAIPQRDACAQYSAGGFKTQKEYLTWIDSIVSQLVSDAVFSVEADAISHTVNSQCLTAQQINERLELIAQTVQRLRASPKVIGVYIDAGHSDWYPDPGVLVQPLIKAGIAQADGIAVNVSNFVATPVITSWSQQLITAIKSALNTSEHYGVIIDTSRNGKGSLPASVTGDARWCNPAGRGIGRVPSTTVNDTHVDAYFWGKNIGESDGSCFGGKPAGQFDLVKALELVRNAER